MPNFITGSSGNSINVFYTTQLTLCPANLLNKLRCSSRLSKEKFEVFESTHSSEVYGNPICRIESGTHSIENETEHEFASELAVSPAVPVLRLSPSACLHHSLYVVQDINLIEHWWRLCGTILYFSRCVEYRKVDVIDLFKEPKISNLVHAKSVKNVLQ